MSTLRVDKLKGDDLVALLAQDSATCISAVSVDHVKSIEQSRYSYSVSVDGKVVMCAGVAEYWQGRGEAWAVIDQTCRKEFIHVHNAVKRFLDVCPIRRIEAAVDFGFEAGHRWVRALGFDLEQTRARHFLPDGNDATIYARVRKN